VIRGKTVLLCVSLVPGSFICRTVMRCAPRHISLYYPMLYTGRSVTQKVRQSSMMCGTDLEVDRIPSHKVNRADYYNLKV
jgi:hypothetical protein